MILSEILTTENLAIILSVLAIGRYVATFIKEARKPNKRQDDEIDNIEKLSEENCQKIKVIQNEVKLIRTNHLKHISDDLKSFKEKHNDQMNSLVEDIGIIKGILKK